VTALRKAAACLALITLTACSTPTGTPTEEPVGLTIEGVVALSDGDYVASTYADGVLPPAEAGHRDLLSTVGIRDGVVSSAHVELSNSVTAAPEVLALSPDGRTAFVAERLAGRQAGDTRSGQLPAGDRLFAVDVTDPGAPAIAAVAAIAESPEALAVHPDGTRVAVVSNTPVASVLQLVPWTPAGFGDPVTFDLAGLGITGSAEGARGGITATNVHWHPGGRALAVNITTQNRVAFLTVDGTSVAPWGEPVTTGVDPFVGRFTPDGRHYLTSDWGRDLAAPTLAERLPDSRSTLSVIEVGEIGSPAPRVVGTAESDKSAEGLAVSPDGRWVATVNMRGTALPAGSVGFDEHASVSLLRRDGATGDLTKIGDYPLAGVLPEGGAFDPSGRYFIATVFEGRPGSPDGPGLQVYRVGPDDAPGLTALQRIPLPHGVHHVAVR
jgi:hypothetical protein